LLKPRMKQVEMRGRRRVHWRTLGIIRNSVPYGTRRITRLSFAWPRKWTPPTQDPLTAPSSMPVLIVFTRHRISVAQERAPHAAVDAMIDADFRGIEEKPPSKARHSNHFGRGKYATEISTNSRNVFMRTLFGQSRAVQSSRCR
jgi:hypothetical protein